MAAILSRPQCVKGDIPVAIIYNTEMLRILSWQMKIALTNFSNLNTIEKNKIKIITVDLVMVYLKKKRKRRN